MGHIQMNKDMRARGMKPELRGEDYINEHGKKAKRTTTWLDGKKVSSFKPDKSGPGYSIEYADTALGSKKETLG